MDAQDFAAAFTRAHTHFAKYIDFTVSDIAKRARPPQPTPGAPPKTPILNRLAYIKTYLTDTYLLFMSYLTGYTGEYKIMCLMILSALDYTAVCMSTQQIIDKLYSIPANVCGNDIVNMYLSADTPEQRSVGIFINYAGYLHNMYIPDKYVPPKIKCLHPVSVSSVSFGDIRGQDSAIENLRKLYTLPYKYPNLFAENSAGILLYGPPGTGKTLLAKAAVSDFKRVAFFAPKPGDLKGKYVGETEKNISEVFNCAARALNNPEYDSAVVFLDEFDSVAGSKTADDPSMAVSVNTLLQEMDGILKNKKVSVIASTNYPWRLEDAILRRFQKRVFVDLANTDAIRSIVLQKIQSVYYDKIIRFLGDSAPTDLATDDVLAFLKSGMWDSSAETRTCPPLQEDVYIRLTERPRLKTKYWFDIFGLYHLMNTDVLAAEDIAEWNELKEKAEQVNFCISNKSAVEYVVSLFTPDAVGIAIRESILTDKQVYDIDHNSELLAGPGLFGYSPSDIEKILDTAFRDAAYRAAQGVFIKQYGIYIPVSQEYAKTYTGGDIYSTGEYVETSGLKDVLLIPREERNRVFNTILTQGDVLAARDASPTIIRNVDYVHLLHYTTLGILPEE